MRHVGHARQVGHAGQVGQASKGEIMTNSGKQKCILMPNSEGETKEFFRQKCINTDKQFYRQKDSQMDRLTHT